MGDAIRSIHVSTEERYFTCRSCGAKGEVQFIAVGDSGYQTGSLLVDVEPDDADVVAEEAHMVDAERVAHLIKCPSCKRRDPAYLRWVYLRVVLWFVAALAMLALHRMFEGIYFYPLVVGIVFALGGLWQIRVEYLRIGRANRARILRLKPGNVPGLADANPVHTLPVAIATEKARPPKIVTPIEGKPVERVEQRGADEEPAFLRKS